MRLESFKWRETEGNKESFLSFPLLFIVFIVIYIINIVLFYLGGLALFSFLIAVFRS